MAERRVLIVDDEPDARYLFRSSIKTIGRDIDIIDVPSGEEALFAFSVAPFDLLIADVRLAGMTGLELMWSLKGRFPWLKVILVTGVEDSATRKKVAEAGADYFFIKPIEIENFIDAVEKCLGYKAIPEQEKKVSPGYTSSEYHLSRRLIKLRKNLDALAVILLDDKGEILAQTGDIPSDAAETGLLHALMATFSSGIKISHYIRAQTPQNVFYYAGERTDLFFAQLGLRYAILIAVPPLDMSEKLEEYVRSIQDALFEIRDMFLDFGVPLSISGAILETEESMPATDEFVEDALEYDETLSELLEKEKEEFVAGQDVDAFWTEITADLTNSSNVNPDAITYEQARKLGLAPEEDEE